MLIREWQKMPDGNLHIHFLDVGQGDSALIVSPSGRQIVIDGGPDFSTLEEVGRRMPFFDRSIDLLVLSHPHLDHLAVFPELLRRYRIKSVLLTGVPFVQARYEEMIAMIEQTHPNVIFSDPTKDLDFGDGVILDIIWPGPDFIHRKLSDVNNASTALRVLYKDQSILFTGDMEEAEEKEILQSGADIRSTILKIAHHGSKTSTSTGFLLAVDPELAVISAGKDNSYGHPSRSTLERLAHFGIPVRTTADEGTISLEF